MLPFFAKHLGTLVVAVLFALALIFAIIKIYKDKKKGHSCGGNCTGCAFSDTCRKKD